MSKLLDMFSSARHGNTGGGMGFLGKSKNEMKPRAAAVVVEFSTIEVGEIEAAVKAGADGVILPWHSKNAAWQETLKGAVEAAKSSQEKVVCGVHFSDGWEFVTHESLEQLKELGMHFIVFPLEAPARLLAFHNKDIDLVVTVPMRSGEMYPIYIRNLTSFDNISAVQLDFAMTSASDMSIEDVIQYRAVREAVRFPALINVTGEMNETEAYTLTTLGIQAVVLAAGNVKETTRQIKAIRGLLEKVHHDEKDSTPSLRQ